MSVAPLRPDAVRRRMPAAARREKIVASARALFAERGYEATTMRMIAERAGVTDALIYRHFASKRELLLDLVDGMIARFGRLAGTADRAPDGPPPPPAAVLLQIGGAFASAFEAESDLVLVLLSARAELGDDRRFAAFIHGAATALGRLLDPGDASRGYLLARTFMGAIASVEVLQAGFGVDDIAAVDRAELLALLVDVFAPAVAVRPRDAAAGSENATAAL